MGYYLAMHHEPAESREKIESRWVGLAGERRAVWMKTWYNFDQGRRFCWWDAASEEILEAIFRDHGVPWEKIVKMELTTPGEWRWRDD